MSIYLIVSPLAFFNN